MKTSIIFTLLTFLSLSIVLAGSPIQSNKDHHKNSTICQLHHKNCNHVVVPPTPVEPPITDPPDNGNGNGNNDQTVSISATSAPFLSIPDKAIVFDTIQVNSLLKVKSIVVNVDLMHSYIGDLVLILRHNGVNSILFSQQGSYLQNLNLTFDDASLTSIANLPMVLPVVGTYQPLTPLTIFNDIPAGGDWTLEITDSFVGDVGTLNSWNIVLETY